MPQNSSRSKKGPVNDIIATTGKVIPNREIAIKCKASGTIIQVPFLVNDTVKKSDLLLEIDPIDEERNVHQANIDLDSSKAKLAQAKQNLKVAEETIQVEKDKAATNLKSSQAKNADAKARVERMKELLKKKLVSQEEYDTTATSAVQAEVDLDNARIQLEDVKIQEMQLVVKRESVNLAEAEVEQDQIAQAIAQRRLSETKVFAPVDAVISDSTAQVGKIISSGITNVGGGTTIMTLCDLSQIFVQAFLDESDIGRAKVEQSVRITATSYPGVEFEGKIITIATKGKNVSNVVTFEVKIEVVSENKTMLKPEMTTNVDIVASKKESVITVPTTALTPRGRDNLVMVVGKDNKPAYRPVKIGIKDKRKVEVLEGLAEGEIISVTKAEFLKGANTRSGFGPPPPMR